MPVILNEKGYEHAKKLIKEGRIDKTERDWSEIQPSNPENDEYIRTHSLKDYGLWHLGIDTEKDPQTKEYYSFPYGDYVSICRSGVIAAESRAGQYQHKEIKDAAKELIELIDQQ